MTSCPKNKEKEVLTFLKKYDIIFIEKKKREEKRKKWLVNPTNPFSVCKSFQKAENLHKIRLEGGCVWAENTQKVGKPCLM